MKKITFLIIAILILTSCNNGVQTSTLPAMGLKVAAVVSGAEDIITKLNNLTTNAAGQGSITISKGAEQISNLIFQLRSGLKDDLSKPISDLNDNLKGVALTLNAITTRLDFYLNKQSNCIMQRIEIVLAGVNTILKESLAQIPFIKEGSPCVFYYKFENQDYFVVPKSGGRLTLYGYLLNKYGLPKVQILDETRKSIITEIESEAATDGNNISIVLDKDVISKNIGKCLQVKITPIKTTLWGLKSESLTPIFLPICIPQEMNIQYVVEAHISFSCPFNKDVLLDFRQYKFENSSCEQNMQVSKQECWDILGGQITGIETRKAEDNRNNSNVVYNIVGNCITASGTLDEASCVEVKIPPFGPKIAKLLHSTINSYAVAPKVLIPQNNILTFHATSLPFRLTDKMPSLNINLEKPNVKFSEFVYSFEIFEIVNGLKNPKEVYSSPRRSLQNPVSDMSGKFDYTSSINLSGASNLSNLNIKFNNSTCFN